MQFLVNLDVDDLDAAIAFYGAAFGLAVGRRFGAAGAELLGGPAPLYLLVKAAGTASSAASGQARSYGRHWTPVHLDFVVEEIDGAVRRAVAAGARLEEEVSVHPWGKLALMADPFGHGFCFVQFVGRGYDEIATDQMPGGVTEVDEVRSSPTKSTSSWRKRDDVKLSVHFAISSNTTLNKIRTRSAPSPLPA